ncbi:hypothetical protein [Lysinibacillus sp. 2017]|uniref:hypothetical protein n=1 Tax=Lysinibacillus sp. 2017 TaxID=2169540 RepID=UPI0010924B5B|nr:hypothetical protein [Lysinibacillus sp. 2017]
MINTLSFNFITRNALLKNQIKIKFMAKIECREVKGATPAGTARAENPLVVGRRKWHATS